MKNITDEKLEMLLNEMHEDNSDVNVDELRPPVINEYRLEKLYQRKLKNIQIALAAAASVVMTTIIICCVIMLTKLYPAQFDAFKNSVMQSTIVKMLEAYSGELKITFIVLAVMLTAVYIFGAALLVKNREKLLQSNSR